MCRQEMVAAVSKQCTVIPWLPRGRVLRGHRWPQASTFSRAHRSHWPRRMSYRHSWLEAVTFPWKGCNTSERNPSGSSFLWSCRVTGHVCGSLEFKKQVGLVPCVFAWHACSKSCHACLRRGTQVRQIILAWVKLPLEACERTLWHEFSTGFSSIKRLAQGAAKRVRFPHRRPVANRNLKASKCNLGELVRCDVAEGSLAKTAAISAVVIILEWGHSSAAWSLTECFWDKSSWYPNIQRNQRTLIMNIY